MSLNQLQVKKVRVLISLISDPVITRQRKPEEIYCNFENFK